MKKETIGILIFSVLLLLLASCKQSEDQGENIMSESLENMSDDITSDSISTEEEKEEDKAEDKEEKDEDILNDDISNSTEPEQEFEDTAPDGITYLKKAPENYLNSKGVTDYGYITKIEESEITVNHVRWITWEDEEWDDSWNSPNGFYVLDDSETDMQHTIAEDCEIWILHDHWYPSYQISFEDLITYIEMTSWDILWRFEIVDEKIITIFQQYLP